MNRSLVLLTLALLASKPTLAETTTGKFGRFSVGQPVQVSIGRAEIPHVEPFLAAHPHNPDLLIGAAITLPSPDLRQDSDALTSVGFASTDGGKSWTSHLLLPCSGDPWLDFGPDGAAYLSCLGKAAKGTLVFRSDDSGKTWSPPVAIPLGEQGTPPDRPVLVVDRSSGPRRGDIYVAHGQGFRSHGLEGRQYGPSIARSRDGAESFLDPQFIRHDNLVQQPFDAEILSNGSLVVVFMDYASGRRQLTHRRTWLIKSDDGGLTFSPPALVLEQQHFEMPWSLAVDQGSKHGDRLYLAIDGFWKRQPPTRSEMEPLGAGGIQISFSDNHGENWSAPTTVTDTDWAVNQETPAIAVNRDGVVGIVWYDTRNSDVGDCFDIYFTASLDGGQTFLPNLRVTPETSCPRSEENPFQGLSRRWAFGGDYSGLAAAADGTFHLFWADTHTGLYQIWTTTAHVTQP
jgi:hypothetical protein